MNTDDGFLFADAGTNVYIGTDGLDPLVIVNDAPGQTYANYVGDQYYSNSTGVHTLGKLTVGSGVVFRDFPTAILAQGAARVNLEGVMMCGNYTGLNVKESAVATLSNMVINRNVFGVIAQDGGHINFGSAKAGVSTPNVLSRNSGASIAAVDGGSVRLANVIVRECPALVGFEGNSIKIDSLVSDNPSAWVLGGSTGNPTGSFTTTDPGTYGTNFSLYLANSTVRIKEPSPQSTDVYALGNSEFKDVRLLGSAVRVETANSNAYTESATDILSRTTTVKADTKTNVFKSATQTSGRPAPSLISGALVEDY